MRELVTLLFLAIIVARRAKAKRRSATGYLVLLLVFGWLGGLLGYAIALRLLEPIRAIEDPLANIAAAFAALYGISWAGQLLGAAFVFALLEMGSSPEPTVPSLR